MEMFIETSVNDNSVSLRWCHIRSVAIC